MTPSIQAPEGKGAELQTSHLHLRWSIADMERIAAMAKAGNSAVRIGLVMNATDLEILAVCRRNGIQQGRI